MHSTLYTRLRVCQFIWRILGQTAVQDEPIKIQNISEIRNYEQYQEFLNPLYCQQQIDLVT